MNPFQIIEFVRDTFKSNEFIPLHAPVFHGNEKKYVTQTIDSTFVSSVGQFVDDFERELEVFTCSPKAVAVVNGTAALHTALYMSGVRSGDMVITQALTFVATCNALYHMGAEPVFVDVSPVSLGLCPIALEQYLTENAVVRDGVCIDVDTGSRISAVVPMHTFGHPVQIDELIDVCSKWCISLVEDAAESLGSFYKGRHTGTFSNYSGMSFNGNKIITTGGGGAVLCNTPSNGAKVKHITTTAKVPHPFEFFHDEAAFNYRMPNLNAALGCAQLEQLERHLKAKRELASLYGKFFKNSSYCFVKEPEYAKSNYWLNAVICESESARDELLEITNDSGVMTRPIWKLMSRLPMYEKCKSGNLTVSEMLEATLVNLPSMPTSLL